MAVLRKINVILGARTRGLTRGLEKSTKHLKKTQEQMGKLRSAGIKMAVAFGAVGVAVTAVAAKFENQMTRVVAIATGGSKQFSLAFAHMENRALDLASTTRYTAIQIAEGMQKMVMSGMSVTTTMSALPAVLDLAAASGIGLAEAADTVTNIMAGFGLTQDKLTKSMKDGEVGTKGFTNATDLMAHKLGKANDVLVATFTGSNTSLTELGASFRKVGPTSSLMKVSMEDTASALGLLGNAGIKAEEAGTGLRRVFITLDSPVKKTRDALKKLGLETGDLSKHGFARIIASLEDARDKFGEAGREAEFNSKLFEAFGFRGGPIMGALLGQGSEAMAKLRARIGELDKANITQVLKAIQLSTFAGQWDLLKSAAEKFTIVLGRQLVPMVAVLVEWVSSLIKWMASWSKGTLKIIAGFIALGTAVGVVIAAIGGVGVALLSVLIAFKAVVLFFKSFAILGGSLAVLLAKIVIIVVAIGFMIGIVADIFLDDMTDMENKSKKTSGSMERDWSDFGDMFLWIFFRITKGVFQLGDWIVKRWAKNWFMLGKIGAGSIDFFKGMFSRLLLFIADIFRKLEIVAMKMVTAFPDIADSLGLSDLPGKIRSVTKELDKKGISLFDDSELEKMKDLEKIFLDGFEGKGDFSFEQFKRGLGAAPTMSSAGWDKMLQRMGGGDAGLLKALEEAVAKAGKVKGLGRDVQLDPEAAAGKRWKESQEELAKIIERETEARRRMMSDFPAFEDLKVQFEESAKAIKSFDETMDGVTTRSAKGVEAWAIVVKNQTDRVAKEVLASGDAASAMAFVAENADALGVSLGGVKKVVDGAGFDDITATTGKSLSQILSKKIFERGAGGGLSKSDGKALSETLGGGLADAITGNGADIAGLAGLAIGSALGNPAIGAAAAKAITSVISLAGNALKSAGGFFASLIPEQRLSGAAKSAVEGGALIATIASVVAALSAVSLVLASIATPAIMLFAFAVVASGGMLLVAIAAVVIPLTLLAAVILGAILPLLLFVSAVNAVIGMFLFIGALALKSKAVEDFFKAIEKAVDPIMDAFDPLSEVLMPLAGLFSLLMGSLLPFVEAFVNGAVKMKYTIFNIAKSLALVAANFLIYTALVGNAMIATTQFFAKPLIIVGEALLFFGNVVLAFAWGMIKIIKVLSYLVGPKKGKAIRDRADAAQDTLDSVGEFGDALLDGLKNTISGLDNFMVDTSALEAARDKIEDSTLPAMDALGNSLLDAADSANELSESLVNVPQGFKVALERFRAISTGEGGTITAGGDNATASIAGDVAADSRGIYANEIVINITGEDSKSILDSVLEEITKRRGEFTGNPFGKQFNPGFG